MQLEYWLGLGSIAFFVLFVLVVSSLYFFMFDDPNTSDLPIDPDNFANPKLLQFISITIAPGGILAAVAFILSKYYGSKKIGAMLIVDGIILLVGMAFSQTLIDKIAEPYITDTVLILPPLFMVLSAPVIYFGLRLMKVRKPRPKKEYF
ncbi:hypothetical protein AAA799E16_01282 [Marine Group I thaumarchaeote SCGC AAA799-E16]|uniref:Uncharacterized protein n=5 Tax=Marine Group I TaxID=905826 RepID=A0A087S7H1_9ARCH|nr:hypothetical protein AAA799N04_01181 [Marine Group I thaumarchaeote SCGC AAA799-N04]KER06040.1 hypothetical protein AAA799E16_01282 [Marine Group I thaumarchaeote SCGC AAA799-E16]KFM16936.1 hypothetical protein AAA799D11_00511 [Marine Group I thaumarchaeote SCGC AAA799-D11]KFM18627.1 hypothetical protein SCCGRSA3_00955 [Marine Group I thaumarchaeote SCGC RSA3]KFM21675.1 hypothetical protein AAA799B03_00700 [Marine Group I thaumarchaeote SCGC AAA799-B03]